MLPIQPIVSNIYIASRQLAKYVVKLFHRAVRPNTLLKVPTSYYSYKKKEYTEKRETYILIDVTSLFHQSLRMMLFLNEFATKIK